MSKERQTESIETYRELSPNSDQGTESWNLFRGLKRDFPGGIVDGNLPANAEDVGSIPGPGRFHMLQGNEAHVPQLLKPGL